LFDPTPLPNKDLAAETLEGLQRKLDAMLQLEEEGETALDYNEVQMLCAAVQMHLVYLNLGKQRDLVDSCMQLYKQLSHLIEQTSDL
jgi:hypothetical protein